MPSKVDIVEKPKKVCSLETLKNKVKLKECERKFNGDTVEKKIAHNANVIRALRSKNREEHRNLAESMRAEERVLEDVFTDRKRVLLALKRQNTHDAVNCIDQKTCEAAKLLNFVHNQRAAREERLKQLKSQVERLENQNKKTPKELNMEQTIHIIENNLDKVNLKMTTAQQLNEQYREIIKQIQEQNRLYPSKLENLQRQLVDIKQELKTLKEGKETAVQAKELANQDLNEAQRNLSKMRKQREQTLSDTRRKIEESRARREHFADKIQKVGRMTHKMPSYFHNTRLSALEGFQMKLLTAQDAFRVLRQNTAITEIADFIERFENQDEVRWRLTEQADNVRKQHDQLTKQKDDLWQEWTQLKYNGMTYISEGEQALENKEKEIKQMEEAELEIQNQLHKQGKILTGVKEVLHALLKKISKCFSEDWFASHSLTDDIDFFTEKIVHIMDEVSLHESDYDRALSRIRADNHVVMSVNNIRIRLAPSTESTESFHYDHHDHTNVPTRDDIKQHGQTMIEMRTRKPKKMKKAK